MRYTQRGARPDTGAAPIGVMTRICSCLHTFLIRVLMIVNRGGRSSIPFFKLFFVLMSLALCEKINCAHYVFIFQRKRDTKGYSFCFTMFNQICFASVFILCRYDAIYAVLTFFLITTRVRARGPLLRALRCFISFKEVRPIFDTP